MRKPYAVRFAVLDQVGTEPAKKAWVISSRHRHPWQAARARVELAKAAVETDVVVLRREPKKVRFLPRPYEATHSGGKPGVALDPESLNYVYREVGVFLPVARGSQPFRAKQLEAMCNILRLQKIVFLRSIQEACEALASLASEQTKEQAA